MRKSIFALLFLLTLHLSLFAQHPDAGWMHPYTAETADKKHIFVMRSRDGAGDYFISDDYPRSGMYLNDGSFKLLWAVGRKSRVYLPNGGQHVVKLGSLYYSATYREEAFTFNAEGKELRTYRTIDLIAFPYLLPHSSAGYGINYSVLDPDLKHDGAVMKVDHGGSGYPINSGAYFDNEKRTMRIETYHGDRYLFDYATGNIISAERPSRDLALVLFGALFVAYSAFLFFASGRRWSRTAMKLVSAAIGVMMTLSVFLFPILSILPYKSSGTPYDQSYPDFWTCCYLSVSMLPQWLLTTIGLFAPPANSLPDTTLETMFLWLIFFWIPCFALFTCLTHFVILFLKSSRRRFC